MKLTFQESTPGEFEQTSAEDLAQRLLKSLGQQFPDLARALLDMGAEPTPAPCACGSCGPGDLSKAAKAKIPKRGGELQLVEDLSVLLSKSYANTLKRMSAHIEEKANEAAAEGAASAEGGA